jgi:geranylgeranyl reductase family protein
VFGIIYDVVISGAGPSGSRCGEVLAKAGYNVALIERNTKWRKPCGGGLNHRVLEMYPKLRKLNLPIIKGPIMHSANYCKLEYTAKEKSWGSVMDRLNLDNFIRNIAVDAGVNLFDKNISFDFLLKNQEKIGIKTKTPLGIKEYQGKIVIIADGMSSKLAIKSGLRGKWKLEEIANAKCAIIEGDHNLEENFIYIYFRSYKGYAWIFPLGSKRFNIGVYTFGEDNRYYNLNAIFQEFLCDPNVRKLVPHQDKVIWSGSYPFPTGGILEKALYDDHIMFIGDTGGFVSPISGEGIQHALLSGTIAADTAIKALELEDYSKKILKQYKTHPRIKETVRSFKMKHIMRNYFYTNHGEKLNRIFELTLKDPEFKTNVIDIFMSKTIPSKEFLSKFQ